MGTWDGSCAYQAHQRAAAAVFHLPSGQSLPFWAAPSARREAMLPESHVMHGRLVRAARVLLGWNQEQLAGAAGVSVGTIRDLENGKGSPQGRCASAIQRALEHGRVRFIGATPEQG